MPRLALLVLFVVLLAGCGSSGPPAFAPFAGGAGDPLSYDAGRQQAFERAATDGLAPVLYEKAPGGVLTAAERTARWRPIVDRVAARDHLDADLLEALIFLESGGRPDVRAGSDPRSATGLTQILAGTATDLLGMHVDIAAARRAKTEARRRRADQRLDPAEAIAGAGRYLALARKALGRDDLALESYHMGIGNLQGVLAAYGARSIPYAQLFFDTTPLRHATAWQRMARLGDDSSTYLWRVYAARDIMRRWRADPTALLGHADAVLHPRAATGPAVRLTDAALRAAGVRVSPQRRTVPTPVSAFVRYAGLGVRRISRAAPLIAGPAPGGGLDVLRRYVSGAQAQAFQFALDRLEALDLIRWRRSGAVIHVTPLAGAAARLAPPS